MVARSIWRSDKFKSLTSDRAQLAFFYYLTCEHQNALGCFRLPDAYAVFDLGWKLQEYQVAKADCITAGLIDFDDETQELLVTRWIDVNPPLNQKHLQGLLKAHLSVESDTFRERLEHTLLEMAGKVQPPDDRRTPYGNR